MDRRIRVLGLVFIVCFALVFLELNNLQIIQAPSLLARPQQLADQTPKNPFAEPRGDIVSADGVILAETTPTSDSNGEQRSYPDGPLFADVTGYYDSVDFAATEVEDQYNEDLVEHQNSANNLNQILTEQSGTDNVVLTVRADLQKVAEEALGGRLGAIIAINPQSGAVLAMYGNPTFDPNSLASHSEAVVHAAYKKDYTDYANAGNAPASPLTNQVTARGFQPGSTMKVITTAGIYDLDPSLVSMVWPVKTSVPLPQSPLMLHNFGGEACGGTLIQILTKSCDTAYALAGVALGAPNLVNEAQAFGFNKVPPIDLEVGGSPDAIAATIPKASDLESNGQPNAFTAYSAIGQDNVLQTVLGNALVAAGIGDGGTIMTPHVMAHIVDDTGKIVTSYQPHPWLQATSSTTASEVRTDMLSVALSGTAANLFPPADNVAAKTGTAETADGCTDNWLIATGPAGSNDAPKVAVAAVIPPQAGVPCNSQETTGASVAGPAVAKLLTAALAVSQ